MTDIPETITTNDQRTTEPGDKLPVFFTTARFFPEAQGLRAQFEWRMAISHARGTSLLIQNSEMGLYHFFSAAADRVFTQSIVTSFLSCVRAAAQKSVGLSHASSPQIQAFGNDCWRTPSQDATPAGWRYLYVLGAKAGLKSQLSLLPLRPSLARGFFSTSRTATISLQLDCLLVYDAELAYGIERVCCEGNDPVPAVVLLAGSLW